MQPDAKLDKYLHEKLPIGKDEKILGVYRHHWFAYVSLWLIGIFLIIAIMAVSIGIIISGNGDTTSPVTQYKGAILGVAILLSALSGLFTFLPVWLKSQEQVVLTEEALLQMLQPSLMANKISQLNLQHVADVSVRQDFFGTMFGYGKISVETPGEQDNYEFTALANPHKVAREIIDAHENFQAALESGRIPTTLGTPSMQTQAAAPIDPQQYNQFLAYQQMVQAQQQQASTQQTQPQQQSPAQAIRPVPTQSDKQYDSENNNPTQQPS